jgi:hypothetical protein
MDSFAAIAYETAPLTLLGKKVPVVPPHARDNRALTLGPLNRGHIPLDIQHPRFLNFISFFSKPFLRMPMLYKQGAQKHKPKLLATPNVFLEDTFTRYFLISDGLINAARMQTSLYPLVSTGLKPARNWFTPIPTMR